MYINMVKTLINTVGILSAVVDKKISYIHYCCKIWIYNKEHNKKW